MKRFLTTVFGIAVMLVVALLVRQALQATYPAPTIGTTPVSPTGTALILASETTVTPTCPADLRQLPEGPEHRCSGEKMHRDMTTYALEWQTSNARPTDPITLGRGQMMIEPSQPGAEAREVVELPLETKLGASRSWQDATSIWHNGTPAQGRAGNSCTCLRSLARTTMHRYGAWSSVMELTGSISRSG